MKIEDIPNAFAETLYECIEASEFTQKQLSEKLGISQPHLSEMKLGKRRCTAEYDLRLSRYFGTSDSYWLDLQTAYHIRVARAKKGKQIINEVQPAA